LFSAGTLFKPHFGEIDKWEVTNVINRILRPGSRVGSWNAGPYGYCFASDVVDLDVLVNNDAYVHLVDRSLERHCREKQIKYLVDPVGGLAFARQFWRNGQGCVFDSLHAVDSVHGQKEHNWIVPGRLNNQTNAHQ
jgi:hypothetical protein